MSIDRAGKWKLNSVTFRLNAICQNINLHTCDLVGNKNKIDLMFRVGDQTTIQCEFVINSAGS